MIAELVVCQAYVGKFVEARKLADELIAGEDLMSQSDFAWCLSAMTSVFVRAHSPDDLAAAESLMRRVLDLSKEAGWSRRRLGKETYSLASIVRVRGRAKESVKPAPKGIGVAL